MARRPNLTKREQADLVDEIKKDFFKDFTDHQVWLDKRAQALEDTFNPNQGEKDYPWEDASNITPPLVGKMTRAVWPRLSNALLGMSPLVQAVAVNPEDREDAEARADWHNHRLVNLLPRFRHTLSTWIIELAHSGDSVLKPSYETEHTYEPEWRVVDNFVPVLDDQGEPIGILEKTDEQAIDEVFETAGRVTKLRGGEYKVTYVDEGFEYVAYVGIDRDDPDVREDQLSLTIEGEKIDRRLHLKRTDPGSLVPPAGSTGYQKDQAERLTELQWMSVDAIEADPNFHNLTKKDIKNLRKMGTGEYAPGNPEDPRSIEDDIVGVPSVWGVTGFKENMIRVLVHYRSYKTRGRRKEMIFWVIPSLEKLGRWDYLKTIYGHGQRPYVNGVFIPLANRPHGIGIWHLVYPYQDEASTILNQMNDRENLVNNPRMLVQANAGITAGRLQGAPPGECLPVKDVSRVVPLTWDINPHGGLPVYQLCVASAEQAAGIGDFQVGVQPSRPNAPRTARGTMALISEGNIILDAHIMLLQESFSELIAQIDGLDEQYLPPETRFLTTGKVEKKITRQQFRSKVRFYLTGNTTNTNQQVQQQTSQLMYQSLVGNPLFTGEYLQMHPVAVENSYRLAADLIKKHSPGNDASAYIPDLQVFQESAQQAQEQQSQAQEQMNEFQRKLAEGEATREDAEIAIKAFEAASKFKGSQDANQMQLMKAMLSEMGNNSEA